MTGTISDAEMCRMIDDVWANDDLCHAADWAELDRRLAAADASGMPPAVMLTWLMMASRAYDEGHLSEWVPFLRRVDEEYAARGHAVWTMLETYRAMADAGPQRKVAPLEVVPLMPSTADSEFLAAIHDAEAAARDHILRGLGLPADVLRGGSYIDTPGGRPMNGREHEDLKVRRQAEYAVRVMVEAGWDYLDLFKATPEEIREWADSAADDSYAEWRAMAASGYPPFMKHFRNAVYEASYRGPAGLPTAITEYAWTVAGTIAVGGPR